VWEGRLLFVLQIHCKKNKSLILVSFRQEMDHKMELPSRKFRGMPFLFILYTEAVRVFF